MQQTLKKIIKKVVPLSAIQNVKGLAIAGTSYYPDYVFQDGKTTHLRSVCIEVTFRCNCRCQMCPLYGVQVEGGKGLTETIKDNEEISLDKFEQLFKDLNKFGTDAVALSGGEPLVRKDILEITKLARDNGLDVNYTSNFGLMTREIAKEFVRLGVNTIAISLDGPKEIHEKIRKAKIFDRIMEAVDWIEEEKRLQGKSKPSMSFLCTVSALNQNHLTELVDIAYEKGLPLNIDPIIFTSDDDWDKTKKIIGDDFIKQESFVMPDEIGKIDLEKLEIEIEEVFRLAKKKKHPVYVSIAGKETRKKFFTDPSYSIVNKCLAPIFTLRIDAFGNVYPCSLSMKMGNIKDNSILDIINGDKFVGFRRKLKEKRLLPFCAKCCSLYSPASFWNYLPKI